MQTTILITGATGTVGREVVKELSVLGEDVRIRAGVHSVVKGENLKRLPGVELVEVEFDEPESLEAAFTHIDKLFLITPFTENQVAWCKTLVDKAKSSGVKHIVKLSALGAGSEPGITLGNWHREMEEYIEESGIPYTFLRPASFMQNFSNYSGESIKQQGKFYQPTGEGKAGYVDVNDIAKVAVQVLLTEGHENKIYTLTGPEALSNAEIAQILSEVTNNEVSFVDVPEDAARQVMVEQMPGWMADAMLELYALQRAGQASTVDDTIEIVTGDKPNTFRDFALTHKSAFC